MNDKNNYSWKERAKELAGNGMSGRKISSTLNIPKSTVSDYLRSLIKPQPGKQKELFDNPPENFIYGAARAGGANSLVGNFEGLFEGKKEYLGIHFKDEEHDNSRILFISDMHIPYHHPDMLEFLSHLKDKYDPTRIICIGDELDKHSLSFHDSDPDLPSAGDELRAALPIIKELKSLFPKMDILESNHGSLVYRKAHASGIPRHYLKSYNDVLGVDEEWKWHFDLTIPLPNGNSCYIHHGKSADVTKLAQTMGMCAIQGHYHETFKVEYWGNPNGLYWGMQLGCLINDKSYAFNYNNVNLKRPIIGTGLVIDSQPILEPMVLNKNGKWLK